MSALGIKLDDLLYRSGAIIIGWPWWSPGCLFAFWWTRFLVALFVAQHGQLNGLHIVGEYVDDDDDDGGDNGDDDNENNDDDEDEDDGDQKVSENLSSILFCTA